MGIGFMSTIQGRKAARNKQNMIRDHFLISIQNHDRRKG